MLPSWASQAVEVLRAPENDGVRRERDWTNATSTTVRGCSLQRSATSADMGAQEGTRLDAMLYAPPHADIRKGDRIRYRGRVFAIEGEPWLEESPLHALDHIVCPLSVMR